MHAQTRSILLVCLLTCGGCRREKSTDELIADLQSPEERARLVAVRLLPGHKGNTAQIVPALIEALKDKQDDIRLSAAIGLGTLGEQARDAIPALQSAQQHGDARLRKAAGVALSRIDPNLGAKPRKK
jgi:HEAT repeat protein